MAVHDYHPGLEKYDPDAILQDGCEECEARAGKGLGGLLELDLGNLDLLWRRCLTTEYGGKKSDPEAGRYRSDCEARLGHQLYLVGVLLQNHEDVWQLDRFAVRP